jgi:hypothetical protein
MVIWLKGNLTPQEMRHQILDPTSHFQNRLISWVESCQKGEFLTGTQEEVLHKCTIHRENNNYHDPTETMPRPPPPMCALKHKETTTCEKCDQLHNWWEQFSETVDDIISKSNIHNCERETNKDGSKNKKVMYIGCKNNKFGTCKARFPRAVYEKTEVDPTTGAINLKKGEPWLNSFTPLLTYLMRSNTDVTCMWSGTAIKAVLIYISDYITKSSLKTHVIFETVKSIFDKHSQLITGSWSAITA